MERRAPERAGRLELAVRPRHRVVQAEDLRDPLAQPRGARVERGEAADVDEREVLLRLPRDDPLGERLPGAPGRGDPHRVEPGTDEEPGDVGRLPHDELVVGGEALGAVVELPDAGALEDGQPVQGALHEDGEVLPVLVEELELERVRDGLGGDPRLGLGLEAADDEPADLLLVVGPPVGVAQDRQVAVDALDLVGDDVEVLGRVERDPHAGERAQRLGPLPGARDDDVALDVAPVGPHATHPSPAGRRGIGDDVEPGDPHPFPHGDPELPGALREGLGEVGGVGRAVAGQPDRPGEVVGAQVRVALAGLRRGSAARSRGRRPRRWRRSGAAPSSARGCARR